MPISTFDDFQKEFKPDITDEHRKKLFTDHRDDILKLATTHQLGSLSSFLPHLHPDNYNEILTHIDEHRQKVNLGLFPFTYLASVFPALKTKQQATALSQYCCERISPAITAIDNLEKDLKEKKGKLKKIEISIEQLTQQLEKTSTKEEVRFTANEYFTAYLADNQDIVARLAKLTAEEPETPVTTPAAAADTPPKAQTHVTSLQHRLSPNSVRYQPSSQQRTGQQPESDEEDRDDDTISGIVASHRHSPPRAAATAASAPPPSPPRENDVIFVKRFLKIYDLLRSMTPCGGLGRSEKWKEVNRETATRENNDASQIYQEIKQYVRNPTNAKSRTHYAWTIAKDPAWAALTTLAPIDTDEARTKEDTTRKTLIANILKASIKQSAFSTLTVNGQTFFRSSTLEDYLDTSKVNVLNLIDFEGQDIDKINATLWLPARP